MSSRGFIVTTTVLQIAMVLGGHFSSSVLGLSAILGVGIPGVMGAVYGATRASSARAACGGGVLIGFVGAFIGILLAILMGDQPWLLLTFGPLSSAVAAIGQKRSDSATSSTRCSSRPGITPPFPSGKSRVAQALSTTVHGIPKSSAARAVVLTHIWVMKPAMIRDSQPNPR